MNTSTPALELRNITRRFDGLVATHDVSMRVMAGERRLIIGPNGAGKTTLFNQITGDVLPSSGDVLLFGEIVTRLKPHRRAHLGLSRTYQIITLFPRDDLVHNIMLGLLGLRRERWNMMWPLATSDALYREARELLDLVHLGDLAERRLSELAYGEKRRVEIALALAQKPRLLLLDEPLAGLSGEERGQLKAVIAAIPRETTVVMIEHDMDTALELCETITLLQSGQVVVDGDREDVLADPRTREVYLGH